jgi:hypothetical protein
MKKYKVLTKKDSPTQYTGEFDPEKWENVINTYAKQGWAIVSCVSVPSNNMNPRAWDLFTVLEKDE